MILEVISLTYTLIEQKIIVLSLFQISCSSPPAAVARTTIAEKGYVTDTQGSAALNYSVS